MRKRIFAAAAALAMLFAGCKRLPTVDTRGKTEETVPQKQVRTLARADCEAPMVVCPEPVLRYDPMYKGYMRYPYSAWKAIEKTCYILNPTAGATTGSKTIYSLPGYDYDITLERVLEKGTTGGFCCAGFVSWLFYNILPGEGYGAYTDCLIDLDDSAYTYKAVLFYHAQNDHALREITMDEAEVGDLIVYGGQRNDHQHIVFYAGDDQNGNALVWHSGQDGVGRMRADRMRTNGVLNYIAHVYSYFEPPVKMEIAAQMDGAPLPGAEVEIFGPLGYHENFSCDENGRVLIDGLDMGNYIVRLLDENGRVIFSRKALLLEQNKTEPLRLELTAHR